jgi:hypothetical protein
MKQWLLFLGELFLSGVILNHHGTFSNSACAGETINAASGYGSVIAFSTDTVDPKDANVIVRSTHSVWYESSKDQIKPIILNRNSTNVSNRKDSIAAPPVNSSWWGDIGKWFGSIFYGIFSIWKVLAILTLIAVLGTVIYLVFRYTDFDLRGRSSRRTKTLIRELEAAKMTELPFEVEQLMVGMLAEATRLRALGDYSKAIIYVYGHVLVQLDDARLIRLSKGKTNRIYLREIQNRNQLKGFVGPLIHLFEFAFFGKHSVSMESFESIWNKLPAFEDEIKRRDNPSIESARAPSLGGVS